MRFLSGLIIVFTLFFFFDNCTPRSASSLFELLPSSMTGVEFSNDITENDSLNLVDFYYIYNGGGVATGDVNNDGLTDIFFTGNQVSCRLYLNQGNFKFKDITQEAGLVTSQWATGVSMVDLNGDGWLDIYVSVGGPCKKGCPNLFFVNQGTTGKDNIPIFDESGLKYGIADSSYTTHAAFLDYDLDGDLDLFLLRNQVDKVDKNLLLPKDHIWVKGRTTDKLYRNEGPGPAGHPEFSDVSEEAGIVVDGYGLGVAISDINKDGWPDIYVANDFRPDDLLYMNQKDGTFKEVAKNYFKHQTRNGMGADIADINNDGWSDIIVLDMLPEDNQRQKTMLPAQDYESFQLSLELGHSAYHLRNSLQLARPMGENTLLYSEIGNLSGISNTDWSWAPLFGDFDNDGFRDLYVTNGIVRDMTDLDFINYLGPATLFGTREIREKRAEEMFGSLSGVSLANYMFRNRDGYTFEKVIEKWGVNYPSFSNGVSIADLDNDGDLDLVVNNINQEAFLFQNHCQETLQNNFLKIKLKGISGNPQGMGAQVNIKYDGKSQYHYQSIYRGYLSSLEDVIHFGLGNLEIVDSLEVIWPDGRYQILEEVMVNQTVSVDYSNSTYRDSGSPVGGPEETTLFSSANDIYDIHYLHQENDYNDFLKQPLLLQMHSRNGPGIAVGDIDKKNGDDFFVGGAAGFNGKFFIQNEDGTFEGRLFTLEPEFEDVGSLLFDADNDSDLDLYIVSGGTSLKEGSELYQDRLYLNDGNGSFSRAKHWLPEMKSSGSCVTADDFDKDGDLDLFVGGRVVPGNYPLPPVSYLLENENGQFRDVTNEIGEGVDRIGMVTSAIWSDFNNDNWKDLVIVGEWMPITILENREGKFEDVTGKSGLSESSGWWNSIQAGDFDNDGDSDYVVGNLGLNTKYKASPQEPVRVYAKDFDRNGSIDPILSCYINDNQGGRYEYPAHSRDAITNQLVKLKKRFSSYEAFSKATFHDLFSEEELDGALIFSAKELQTSYLENSGNGKFLIRPFPLEVQFSQVHGIVTYDFDGDGNLDLIIGGNSYATESQDGWYDASVGILLKGDGTGEFDVVDSKKSGLLLDKDVRSIAKMLTKDNTLLVLAASNNDSLIVISPRPDGPENIIKPGYMDSYALLYRSDGQTAKVEFSYGSSYLSQSSRYIVKPLSVDSIIVFDYEGKPTMIK